MARYIDADKLCEALKSMASVQYPDKQNTILGVVSSIENFPAADVVPKSEVAELEIKLRQLEDKLRQYEQVCGKLAIKDGVAVGLIDGKETVYILKSISKVTKELAVRRTKVEVARVIFDEIEASIAVHAFTNKSDDYAEGAFDTIEFVDSKIDELRKKYIGGEA